MMTMSYNYLYLFTFVAIQIACSPNDHTNSATQHRESTLFEKLENVNDSIHIGGITVYNSFKHQLLAHQSGSFDSTLILEKVYRRHQSLWNNCFGMIFGQEKQKLFTTDSGMVAWNRSIYQDHQQFMEERVNLLLQTNTDSIITASLQGFNRIIGPYAPKARISFVFSPIQDGLTFGGCAWDQWCLDLMKKTSDVSVVIREGFPHEVNHLAYRMTRTDDPHNNTALAKTIDEGLACYYTYKFFDGEISKARAVERMTDSAWQWYEEREKEIFTQSSPYFYKERSEVTPYSCNCNMHQGEKLFENAPHTICYWLGFQIIESYEKNNGEGSWKEVYELPVKEVLKKSGYAAYISRL